MKPIIHARLSADKYGGCPEDYLPIHEFMDSTKAALADVRHRAILHSAFGCFLVERVFGPTAKNSEGLDYVPRDVAEDHCLEDLGTIPTLEKWLSKLPIESWMGRPNKDAAKDKPPTLTRDLLDQLNPNVIPATPGWPNPWPTEWWQGAPTPSDISKIIVKD
jgi:hypothetical protein